MSNEKISPVKKSNILSATSDDCVIPSLRFPQKLWRIVNECKTGAISWGSNGLTVLLNYKTFQEEYLNCNHSIFKTTNIASFIRQLNLYGFRKVTSHNRDFFGSGSGNGTHDDLHEFLHEHFRAGRLDLLSRVCRKTGIKKNLLQTKQTDKTNLRTKDENRMTGMSRLQMCQIALTKALEQATRQYRKEKFWLQLLNENLPKDALKPKYKEEASEQNIQIIFQDLSDIQDAENLPIIDAPIIGNVIDYQDKVHWEEILTLPLENSVSISVPH